MRQDLDVEDPGVDRPESLDKWIDFEKEEYLPFSRTQTNPNTKVKLQSPEMIENAVDFLQNERGVINREIIYQRASFVGWEKLHGRLGSLRIACREGTEQHRITSSLGQLYHDTGTKKERYIQFPLPVANTGQNVFHRINLAHPTIIYELLLSQGLTESETLEKQAPDIHAQLEINARQILKKIEYRALTLASFDFIKEFTGNCHSDMESLKAIASGNYEIEPVEGEENELRIKIT